MYLLRNILLDSLTIAVIVLALFSLVLLRLFAVGCITSGPTAMTLFLGIARFFSFVTFIRAHVNALDSTPP